MAKSIYLAPHLALALLDAARDVHGTYGSKSSKALDAHDRLGDVLVAIHGGPFGFRGQLNPDGPEYPGDVTKDAHIGPILAKFAAMAEADRTAPTPDAALEAGVVLARRVVANWERGDLAGAVNGLREWADDVESDFPGLDLADDEDEDEDDETPTPAHDHQWEADAVMIESCTICGVERADETPTPAGWSHAEPVGDDPSQLPTKDGVVSLCDISVSGPDAVLARFDTIGAAEAFLNLSATIDPDKLAAGGYSIDAPLGLGADIEAVPVAERMGFDVFYSMGNAYFTKGPHRADMTGWSRGYPNTTAAAWAALATVEP